MGQRETPWSSWLGIWRGVSILETPAMEDNEPKTALNATELVGLENPLCPIFAPLSIFRCRKLGYSVGNVFFLFSCNRTYPYESTFSSTPKFRASEEFKSGTSLDMVQSSSHSRPNQVFLAKCVFPRACKSKRYQYPPKMCMRWTSHVELSRYFVR